MDKTDAQKLFKDAVARVESKSIREWATSDHNGPIFVRLAEIAIEKKGPTANPSSFCAFIVSKAIGLV